MGQCLSGIDTWSHRPRTAAMLRGGESEAKFCEGEWLIPCVLSKIKAGYATRPHSFLPNFAGYFGSRLAQCLYVFSTHAFFFAIAAFSISFHQGGAILLPKPGGDPAEPRSWRHISLLNFDYRLFSGLLVARQRSTVPLVVFFKLLDVPPFIPSYGACTAAWHVMWRRGSRWLVSMSSSGTGPVILFPLIGLAFACARFFLIRTELRWQQ